MREGSNEEEEEDELDDFTEEIPRVSPNGLKIHITSDSQDEGDQFSESRHWWNYRKKILIYSGGCVFKNPKYQQNKNGIFFLPGDFFFSKDFFKGLF